MRKKKIDHYFMVDECTLNRMCEHANLSKKDRVLEVGAGTGNLTTKLASSGAHVFAIEKDEEFFLELERNTSGCKNVEVFPGDALKIDLPNFNKVVSNLPYSISKKITVRLLGHGFELGVLTYQREYARKLTACAGDPNYKFISALAQSTSEIQLLENLPPNVFSPQPNVWSTVVRIKPVITPAEDYIRFLQNLFNHRKKKIKKIIDTAKTPEKFWDIKPINMQPEEILGLYECAL